MGEVSLDRIRKRRDQLVTQLQECNRVVTDSENQLEQAKARRIATQGAIAALDEILAEPDQGACELESEKCEEV